MKNAYLIILASFFCLTNINAQTQDVYTKLSAKYPDDPAVFVDRSEVMTITVEKDSLKITADNFEDVLHLKNQTNDFISKKVYGSHFTNVSGLKARTLVWEKEKYREVNVSSFKKSNERADHSIFYDDSYYYAFDYPSIAAKNRTQLEYKHIYKDPRFISGFVFGSYLPQAKATFVINASRDVELFYQVVNDPGGKIKFKKTEKGKNVVYEWTTEDMAVIRHEEESPSYRYFVPHVICYVKSYQTKGKKVTVLNSLNDLYAWYSTFVEGLNKDASEELKNAVAEIKKVSKTEEDLVKNVFYWVQDNIQYIAFEEGMRGFIPHDGSYVCEKRYGDCKDMANLIVNMLSLAGVKSYYTWIGTRDLPYKYTDVPTPLVDNHMIATYISPKGEYYFLDATSDYTTFGLPSSMIQGKEALIAKDSKTYELKIVPVVQKEKNIMTDSLFIKLDQQSLTGSGRITLNGFPKVFGGYELDRAEADDVKDYVTKLSGKGNNKYYLDDFTVKDLKDRSRPTAIDYKFRISDYFQKVGDEIYLNLNLNKDFYNASINVANRKTSKEIDYAYVKQEYIEFEIPKGYKVEYVPENTIHHGNLMSCEINYKVSGNKIVFKKKLLIDYLLMQPEQFESWNQSVKALSTAYKESIILRKN
jgi:hypothetical protein